jgi:hypothetical protein
MTVFLPRHRYRLEATSEDKMRYLTDEQAFAVIQSALVFVQASKGFGKTPDQVSTEQLIEIGKVKSRPTGDLGLASDINSLPTPAISSTSSHYLSRNAQSPSYF